MGGSVKCFDDMDSDEWGIMTLREKVQHLGYKKEDSLRCFSNTDNGLEELVVDLDTWNLVNCGLRPKVLEIWVIIGVIGEDEHVNEGEDSGDESDWENEEFAEHIGDELEEFEGSDYEIDQWLVDDQDFDKYT